VTTVEQSPPTFQDVWRMFQETSLSFKKTERLMKEHAAEIERLMNERASETHRQMLECVAETERIINNLGDRMGEFVEHMVAPAVVRLFQAEGIEAYSIHPGFETKRNGEAIEVDLLVVTDGTLLVVECKSKLTLEHVDEHLRRMEKFKRLQPLYKNYQAMGAVAAMVISDGVKDYAHSQGLYVLRQNGDSIEVSRPTGFLPKCW